MKGQVVEPVNTRFMQVGMEVFPVYGDEDSGWSMEPGDFAPGTQRGLRYGSLDELYFALVNLNITPEGQA